jgi:nitrate/nitrite transporter NarK
MLGMFLFKTFPFQKKNVKLLTVSAIFIVITLIAKRFFTFMIPLFGLESLKIGVEYIPLMIAGFILFELALNGGPHLITFILPSQIFPIAERGIGAGIAAAFGKAGAVVGVFLMPMLMKWGGVELTLAVIAALQVVGAAITNLFGKSLLR